jgi:hypothetical protein
VRGALDEVGDVGDRRHSVTCSISRL